MTPKTIRVIYEAVEPNFEVCHYLGERLVLTGPLAMIYRGFKVMNGEETAQEKLAPWLIAEVEKKKAATAPQQIAAPTLINQGI